MKQQPSFFSNLLEQKIVFHHFSCIGLSISTSMIFHSRHETLSRIKSRVASETARTLLSRSYMMDSHCAVTCGRLSMLLPRSLT